MDYSEIEEHFENSESEDEPDNLENLLESSSEDETDEESDEEERPLASSRRRIEEKQWLDSDFKPAIHDFTETISGLKENTLKNDASEIDCFCLFFNPTLVSTIIAETNSYARTLQETMSAKSKLQKWTDLNQSEFYTFLATMLLTSVMGKKNLQLYWSTNKLIETPYFRILFSQDRFFLILRALHFSDNRVQSNDRLYKIRPIYEALKKTFKDVFYPYRNICIDESLMLWKGRLSFRQYMPSKRHRFGIKFFVCCDVKTGFVLDVIIYTGASTEIEMIPELGLTGSVVTTMLQNYFHRGHTVFLDNWYSSPTLFEYLHERKTNACGTVKANRKGMPKFRKLKKGEVQCYNTDHTLALKWMDKREVHIISTIHMKNMIETDKIDRQSGNKKHKPEAVLEYNANMGSVDKTDMMMSFAETTRKTLKWYKKVFFRLLDVAVLNSFILYRHIHNSKLSFYKFRLQLIEQLVEKYYQPRASSSGGRPSTVENPVRLTARHFPHPVQQTAAQGSRTQRRCYVCAHTKQRPQSRKETRYMCVQCDVALCVHPCFEAFHTQKIY